MANYASTDGNDSGFWASAVTEPKRKYRFTLAVQGLESWTITKVKRPSFKLTDSSHIFYNHKFNFPGRVEWDPVSFTTVDPINPDSTGILMKMLMASGYEFPDKQFGGAGNTYNSVNKVSSVDAINPIIIKAYDAQGSCIEKWTLKNAFVSSVDFGEYDYSAVDMLNIQVTLKYDWATLENMGDRAPLQTTLAEAPIPNSAIEP